MPRETLIGTEDIQLNSEDIFFLETARTARENAWREHLERYPLDQLQPNAPENPEELRRWLALKEQQYNRTTRYSSVLNQLRGLMADIRNPDDYFRKADQFNRLIASIPLPDQLRKDKDIIDVTGELSFMVENYDFIPREFHELQESIMPGLQKLSRYFDGELNRGPAPQEQAELDRLDDQYLGSHLTPASSTEQRIQYQRAEDRLQSQREVRYKELTAMSDSLLGSFRPQNLLDPGTLRSSIQRINRVYSALGLGPEDIRAYLAAQDPDTAAELTAHLEWIQAHDRWRLRKFDRNEGVEEGLKHYLDLLTNTALYKDGYTDCTKPDFSEQRRHAQEALRDSFDRLDGIISPQEANQLTDQNYSPEHLSRRYTEACAQVPDASAQDWYSFSTDGDIKTLNRESSRSSFVDLLMLADGYSFDSLFSTDPRMAKARGHYGRRAYEFLSQHPSHEQLEELFRKAGETLMDAKLPNLDIAWKGQPNMDKGADRNTLLLNWATEQNLERAGALSSFLQDYYQFPSDELRAFITQCPHQTDHEEINEAQNVATAYCDSINTLGTLQRDLATPGSDPKHPGNFIRQRFYLEQFGHTLEHATIREAVQKVSPDEIERLGIDVIGKINPTGDQDAIDFATDPLTRSARSFGFIVGQDGHLYRAPSKDIAEVDLKLNQCRDAQGQLTAGAVYQSIENLFAGNPIDQESQELLKRIYVDGENAYDKYRYTADRSLVPLAAVRQNIIQDITRGKKRVELVRFETLPENNRQLGMVILPIHVDYTGTAASPEDIAYHEQLWQNDPQKAGRHQQITADAAAREKQYRDEIKGLNALSSTMTEEMKQVRGREPYASQYPTLAMAQEVMAENPDEVREWVQLKMKKDQNTMMKELSEAVTVFWSGPEGNPAEFSAALNTLDRYMKIWIENDQIMAPPGQNPRYAFGAIQELASMKEEDRAEKFYQLFHDGAGNQHSQMDTMENRLNGLQTSLRYFMEQEQASALTDAEKRRIEELDRKYLGCIEGEVSADRYLETEKVFAQARTLKRDELTAMSHCMLEQVSRYSQADFPPEQTRLCLKGLSQTLTSLNLTQEDLDRYMATLPQAEQQRCQDTLNWVHATEQQALRDPLTVNGQQPDLKNMFNFYISLGINAAMYRDGYLDCMNRAEMNQLNSWRDHRIENRKKELEQQASRRIRTNLAGLEAQESGPDRHPSAARESQRARSSSRKAEPTRQGPSK